MVKPEKSKQTMVEKLLLEALEEKDVEKAVELFLVARLIKISHEKTNQLSQ